MPQIAEAFSRPVAAFSKSRQARMGGLQTKPTCAGRHDPSRCVDIRPKVIPPSHPVPLLRSDGRYHERRSSLQAHVDLRYKPNFNCQQKQ